MRVLFLPSWFPSEKNPHGGSFISDLANDINTKDIDIEVAAFHYNYSTLESRTYEKASLTNGAIVHHFFGWTFPKVNVFAQKSWIKTCIEDLEEHTEIEHFDCIHAHDYVASFLAYEVSKKYNVPVINSFHHSDFIEDKIPSWRANLLYDIFPHAAYNIVPSSQLKTAIETDYDMNDVLVIPNYIDGSEIKRKSSLSETPEKFICVSSDERVKNNGLLIEFALRNNIQLDIYGSIENAYAKSLKGNSLIRCLGKINRSSLLHKYSEYDAYISMSSVETFGLSIVEALSSGIPCIVKNQAGSKDYLTDENGIFMDDHEDPLLVFKQRYSSFDPEQIHKNILDQYDIKNIIPQYISFYRKLLASSCVV